ncbi:MAG: type IV pilin protein [Burkholderiales bacterium]
MSLSELMAQPTPRGRRERGFTLIELMICIAVVGVLSSIAYPAFSSTMVSTRRSDALLALMKVQLLQERFRSEHPRYGELSQLGLDSTSPSRHYEIAVRDQSADGYVVQASAIGSQQQDTRCRHLRLTVDGLNVVYASGATEATDNVASVNSRCWKL